LVAESEKVRAHIYVSGRVQGVYFRRDTMTKALRLGLKGWVRNLPDKKVEAVAEGEEENVEEFIRWCHEGPPLAIVRGVEVSRERPTGEFETFRILR
jgi:acylphosphatase